MTALPNATAATNTLFVFTGRIQAIDRNAGTFTLKSDKRSYLFLVTSDTRFVQLVNRGWSIDYQKGRNFSHLKEGQAAQVEMKVGEGRKGIAVLVIQAARETDFKSRTLDIVMDSVIVGKTASGQTISGYEKLDSLVVSRPGNQFINRGINFSPLRLGIFLLSVRPDGTVANVQTIQSFGYPELDARSVGWFMKWRFKPNSFAQVRIPVLPRKVQW